MSRGKYNARAANRLAALDNQLLHEQRQQINQLETDLIACEQRLKTEIAQRDALVIRRADELAAKQIAAIRATADAELTAYKQQVRKAVDILTDQFRRDRIYPNRWIDVLKLVLKPNEIDDHLNTKMFGEGWRLAERSSRLQ